MGTFKGSYFATQGETGLTLKIYKEKDKYKALFDFYNLPGKTNAQSGKYYMDVTYDAKSETYKFKPDEWIVKPSTYSFVSLAGALDEDVLSGESPTKFSVTRVDEDAIAEINFHQDAFEYNGHYYQVYQNTCDSWDDAKAYCESMGGYLAVINDEDENKILYSYITSKGIQSAYFGLTDSAEEGTWKWVNNEKADFVNWSDGEPNNEGGSENYAMFYYKYTDGKWNDGNFGNGTENDEKTFICEWDE